MFLRILFVGIALIALGCGSHTPELRTVPQVDLNRYTGKWYEIATIPSWFQKDCVGTTASYSLRDDGTIRVENVCHEKTLDGPERSIVGKAWVTDRNTFARLEVQFFWPISGPYWIIALDPQYRYAMVGHPSREYLWILSRAPQMNDALYEDLLTKAERQGYDVQRVQRTPQPAN
jgi:apolipoprotein D and lipocalin family protein